MNKFKKILLGALSVLTLGLVAVTGAKVNAVEVAGTDYWELYRSDSSSVVNTGDYFTYSMDSKNQTVTNTNVFTKHDGTSLANLNLNFQIASSGSLSFTTGDFSDGYILEILMVGNKNNSNVKLNDVNLSNVGANNLEKVTASLTKSTEYTLTKGANGNYIHYVCVYKAIVSSNSYTLNYDANGHGTAPNSIDDVKALSSEMLSQSISADNYRFDGWYMEKSCVTKATTNTNLDDYAPNGVVTLYAKWIQTKTISFYDVENTETAIKNETYDYDSTIDYEPVKENATFAGWYTDIELTNQLTSLKVGESTPSSLYAKFDTLSYTGNPNSLTSSYLDGNYVPTTPVSGKTNLTGLNFYLTKDLCKQTIKINSINTNVIYLGGTGSPTNGRALGFNSTSKGILKVNVFATGDRAWGIYDVNSGSDCFVSNTLSKDVVHEIQVNVEADNTYEIYCKNNKCYIVSAEFIPVTITPAQDAKINVTPFIQKAVVGDYTYVRFITIVSGVNAFNASDLEFTVTMDYAQENVDDKTITYVPFVVNRITNNGETYVDGGITFNNATKPTEYYVVKVLRFTTANFDGNSVYSKVTFNGNTYTSDVETIGKELD